jgi:hypothetical protein
MSNLEKEYFNKWMEQVEINKDLTKQLDYYKKQEAYFNEIRWQIEKYKKYFEPLARAYKKAYSFCNNTDNILNQMVELYNKYILLNPNIKSVLKEEDKNHIIKEIQILLSQFLKIKKPLEFDIIRDTKINTKTPKTVKKEFERKNFVVKKNK